MTRRRLVVLLSVLLPAVAVATAETRRAVFLGTTSEHKWTLRELNPDLPSDWSGYEFLVLELRASSPQRYSLRIFDATGVRSVAMHPFGQNVWLRASLPLKYFLRRNQEGFDLASMGNKSFNSYWMGVNGPHGPLTAVEAIGVTMQAPLGKPTLEIRSVRVTKEDPGSDYLEKLPVVDQFGQWARSGWPSKAKNLGQLKREWAEEEKSMKPGDFNYCKYGGYLNTKAKATGFFRVEQIDGKWWFVDPDGHLFLGIGVPGLGTGGGDTRVEGREKYYAALPPENLLGPLGPSMATGRRVSFRSWNLFRRYGEAWRDKAVEMETKRMDAWGLTVGESGFGGVTTRQPTKPYLTMVREWQTGPALLGMPDVYSEEFPRMVDQAAAKALTPHKDDPYLIGFYVGNEMPWPNRQAELVDMILAGKDTPMQRAAKTFLAAGDTPERRKEFVLQCFQKYLDIIGAAVKKYDPNHLNLGLRFGGAPDEVVRMTRVFDIYSLNPYAYEPTGQVKKAYELTGRPILIGEFHNGVPGHGLAASLVQVRDQKERGVGYRYYLEQAAALPGFVGANWFVAVDESVTGRMDGENYNFGWVDVTDRPYTDLIEAAKVTHKRLFDVHSGKEPPFDQKPKAQ